MRKKAMIVKKSMHAPKNLNEPVEYGKSFSRGMSVGIGPCRFLFISGTASIDNHGASLHKNDFLAQAERTFANLTALLESENSGWDDVVHTRCYLKSMRYYGKFNAFRNSFYSKQKIKIFPASVCVEAVLCRPELLVEIEAVAIVKGKNIRRKTR